MVKQDVTSLHYIHKGKIICRLTIILEYEDERVLWMHLREETKPFEPELPSSKKLTTAQYLQKHIFSLLCPILEETLSKAQSIGCLKACVSVSKILNSVYQTVNLKKNF